MYIPRSIFTALLLTSSVNAKDYLRNQKRSAEEALTPEECAAKENGLELFPPRDPADQQMKVETVVDTETCTYDITVSYKPDPTVPFITSPRGGVGRPSRLDVPLKYRETCDADGFIEADAGTDRSPLDPVNHTGTRDYYTEFSYTVYTSDKVAEMTGVKDVVLGTSKSTIQL